MIKTHTVWLNKDQIQELLSGKRELVYAKKARGRGRNAKVADDDECDYIVKMRQSEEDIAKQNKKLQGQVYNYRHESKKLKDYLIAKGINPTDVINQPKEEQ